MKKKVLMSLVLLAIIGTSAVFAQQPTLDKLKFGGTVNSGKNQIVTAANKSISGTVVIPGTYNGLPIEAREFNDCTQITSVIFLDGAIIVSNAAFSRSTGITSLTFPASMTDIASNAFRTCDKLTSVTFGNSTTKVFGSGVNTSFPGDLDVKYKAGGAGTYTRTAGSNTWTKEGGGFSLNGTWTRSDGMKITITDNGQNITITGDKPNNGGKLNDTYRKQ